MSGGLYGDANNYIMFTADAGSASTTIQAETASGGVVTTTDTGVGFVGRNNYILKIHRDPLDGDVVFEADFRGPNYHPDSQMLNVVATHTTNIPSVRLEPRFRWASTEAANQEALVDFMWFEGDRSP